MSDNTGVYEEHRSYGKELTPDELLSELSSWKVADIAKCYGCNIGINNSGSSSHLD